MTATEFATLSNTIVLRATGRHARRYLNARFSNDVQGLHGGKVLQAAALTAQGRTQVLAQIINHVEDFFLIIDGGAAPALIAEILRFKVADDVNLIEVTSAYKLVHLLANPAALQDAFALKNDPESATQLWSNSILWPHLRVETMGYDLLVAEEDQEYWTRIAASVAMISSEQFESRRIGGGQPSFPAEINEETILSETGPQAAVSFTKGCYVGQEVVARIDSRGRPPRRLIRVRTDGNRAGFAAHADLCHPSYPRAVGTLLSVALNPASGGLVAFAIIKNDPGIDIANLTVGGNPVAAAEI